MVQEYEKRHGKVLAGTRCEDNEKEIDAVDDDDEDDPACDETIAEC